LPFKCNLQRYDAIYTGHLDFNLYSPAWMTPAAASGMYIEGCWGGEGGKEEEEEEEEEEEAVVRLSPSVVVVFVVVVVGAAAAASPTRFARCARSAAAFLSSVSLLRAESITPLHSPGGCASDLVVTWTITAVISTGVVF
jgi:hypothetical protein